MMVETCLMECRSLPREGRSGLQLMKILQACGGAILTTSYGFVEKNPEERIDPKGNTDIPRGLEHPLLGKGRYHHQKTLAPTREHGTGSFSYIHADRQFTLCQDLKEQDSAHWDEIAGGLLSFVRMIYPHLRPLFGGIDDFGYLEAKKVLVQGLPRILFWANIFGPELAAQIGKEFLLQAPGWKKEELDDGGILYVIEPKYHQWHEKPSKEALRYFQAKIPQMRVCRAKSVGLPEEIVRMVQFDEKTGKETVVHERGATRRGKRKQR